MSESTGSTQHLAMLHLLELLMNAPQPGLPLPVLVQRLQHRPNGGAEAAAAIEQAGGMRAFLMRHPALFSLNGDLASAVGQGGIPVRDQHRDSPPIRRDSCGSSSFNGSSNLSAAVMMEVARESEAVRFFQCRLGRRREDRWVPIKSLAGHLSQAPAEVRAVVGPQSEFGKFLAKHRHVFEIQGELVGLRDTFPVALVAKQQLDSQQMQPSAPTGPGGGRLLRHTHSARSSRPRSMLAKSAASCYAAARGSLDDSFAGKRPSLPSTPREASQLDDELFENDDGDNHSVATSGEHDPDEFRAVAFVRRVLDRSVERPVTLGQLFAILSSDGDSAERARNFIGCTQLELEEFLRKRPRLFELESTGPDAVVSISSNQYANFSRKQIQRRSFRLGSQSSSSNNTEAPTTPRFLSNRRGRVFHCAKLWGIIDLGRHEHVFFDRSIFKHMDDLQKYFKVNDTVYFNAILATKDSRAKWRATQVWRESDRQIPTGSQQLQQRHQQHQRAGSGLLELADDVKFLSDIDESELRRVLGDDPEGWSMSSNGSNNESFNVEEDNLEEDLANLKLIGSRDAKQPNLCSQCAAAVNGSVATVSVATQTMSTGEIMAMQIFHDL